MHSVVSSFTGMLIATLLLSLLPAPASPAAEAPDLKAIGLHTDLLEGKFGAKVSAYVEDRLYPSDREVRLQTAQVMTTAVLNRSYVCIEVVFSKIGGKFTQGDVTSLLQSNGHNWKVLRKPSSMDRDYRDGITLQDDAGNFARLAVDSSFVLIRSPERIKHLDQIGQAGR